MGDPPLVVGHNENVELETQLAEVKAELKASKEEARLMIEEMEKMGRDLASRESSCRSGIPVLANEVRHDRLQECRGTNGTAVDSP